MKQGNHSEVRMQHEIDEMNQSSVVFQNYDQESGFNQNRMSGLVLLAILFAILWIYGWAGEITLVLASSQPSNWTSQSIYGKLIIMSAVFTVIGFGMLFTYFKHSMGISFFVTLFIVSFTFLASPFVQKFWFNVFISDFKGMTFSTNNPDRFFYNSFQGLSTYIDLYNLKVTFANCISQLVVFLGVFGKISITQIVFHTILYNICWNLNHFLCALLQINSPDTRIFDDYQISNVYLFAACYSLMLCLILKKPIFRRSYTHDPQSVVIALLGTFFVFMSFCTTSTLFPLKFTPGQAEYARSYIWQEAFLSSFFSLSASVIFTLAFSIIFGRKIGIKQTVFGTITGGIIYGAVAGTAVNIGAAIACGLVAGLISAVYFRLIYKRVNDHLHFDSYGIMNILIISFVGTFVLAPIILITYYNRDWILTTLEVSNFDYIGKPLVSASIVGWILAYVGISMGIAIVSGTLSALLLSGLGNNNVKGSYNQQFFTMNFGLTRSNPEIFGEDINVVTEYQRVLKVLRNNKAQEKAIVNHFETVQIKRQQSGLQTKFKRNVEVELFGVAAPEYEKISSELLRVNKRIKIQKGVSINPIQNSNPEHKHISFKQYRVIYYLAKSKKLERTLSSSSLQDLKLELNQRSLNGFQDKRVSITGAFNENDQGVSYLSMLKQKYDDLSLQTIIKS